MNNDKLVCGCMKVTVQEIKDAITNGTKSFEEVQKATNVSYGCGSCEDSVRDLVNELLGK